MDVEKDEQEIIERVAALDIGKAELVCCVRFLKRPTRLGSPCPSAWTILGLEEGLWVGLRGGRTCL